MTGFVLADRIQIEPEFDLAKEFARYHELVLRGFRVVQYVR